jgi:uncharacterized lipoprotein YmbA
MMRLTVFAVAALLAGCGAGNDARYLIDPPAAVEKVPVRVGSIEVRDVSLPSYAAAVDIAQQEPDGALRNIAGTLWADDPVRGITGALARSLDQATTASVAAEPWPLAEPAQAELSVRVERMLAGADGQFRFAGQYALSSRDGVLRDRLRHFDITTPLTADGSAGIAGASGSAIAMLAAQIAEDLRR